MIQDFIELYLKSSNLMNIQDRSYCTPQFNTLRLWGLSFVLQTTCAYIWGQYLFNDCRMVPHPSKFSTCIIVLEFLLKVPLNICLRKRRSGCHHVVVGF